VTELQQNRYDSLLRRVGDLKGPGSKVNDVLQELFPTIDVENVPGELLFLMGTRIGWGSAARSPSAGKIPGVQLFNPVGSGHLISVSDVVISINATTPVSWGIVLTTLPINTGIPRIRDSRVGVGQSGVSELRTSVDAVAPVGGQVRLLTNTAFHVPRENTVCVLAPGTGLTVTGGVDIGLTVSFVYRERIAEPSELNL